jgi:hypothetical protein
MTLRDPMFLENAGEIYNAREYRALLDALFGSRPGVFTPTDLAVSQQAVPALGVTVAAGSALVPATGPGIAGVYFLDNDADANVAIAAPDATNPRRDIVGLRVRDSESGGADNDGAIAVITGTPNAVPVDPVLPANFLPLARIAVAALAGSIVNANITDLRRSDAARSGLVTATGGTIHVPSAALRPTTGLYAGLELIETDTLRRYRYSGTAWVYVDGGNSPYACKVSKSIQAIANSTDSQITFDGEVFDDGGMHAGVAAAVVLPVAGDYHVGAGCKWASNVTGTRRLGLRKNGASFPGGDFDVPASGDTYMAFSTYERFAAGDAVTLNVAQFAGGPLNVIDVRLWVAKV